MPISSLLRKRKALLLSTLLACFVIHEINAQNTKTEILWDTYGVPHIYAKNNREMYYAFGWAQMNNHANLLLQLYGQARGRAAEYWGTDYLESDKQILIFDLPEKAKEMYSKQTQEYKEYTDAFVKGINDYAKFHPETIDENMKQVLPVTASDVFANSLRTMFRFLTANERAATEKLFQPGSNAYAIGPSRSVSKNAMLVINPHLPWKKDFTLLFEAHLHTNEFNAYGTTAVGTPTLTLAFNDNLGWTHTVNTLDASDRYELSLQNDGYLLDGVIVPFDKKTMNIKIRQPDGKLLEQKLEIKNSRQGPVVGEKNNKAYVIRVAGLDNYKTFEEYHKMAKAGNWAEFESAIKMLQIPMFNILYADKAGNIFYLFNGNIPKRPEGDFAYWRGTIDGTRSNLIWQETLTYADLPKVLNPPTGFLQNANDPPWNCTYPSVLDPKKFLPYVAPHHMAFRPQRAVNLIKNDSSISFDELISYKLNTGVEAAERFLDDLLTAVDKFPDTAALKAASILKAWDKKTDAASKGAVLFSTWFDKITPAMYTIPWDRKEPVSTPDGLKDNQQAVALLVKSVNEVEKKYGSLDIAWGDVYRLRMNSIDLPASGGRQQQGVFMSLSYTEDKDNKSHADGGETFMAVIEFGKTIKVQVLLSYGNATQPGSKHIGDQLKLLSQKKLRPAWLSREEILRNLEKKEVLNVNGFN
jgi:acyl-homoserine-lactone acylase